jgi:hypothetical protein
MRGRLGKRNMFCMLNVALLAALAGVCTWPERPTLATPGRNHPRELP